MDMALSLGGTHLKISPINFSHGVFRLSPCFKEFPKTRLLTRMVASADYSRRRPRKSVIRKTKSPAPKGFRPRSLVGTSSQKKVQSETGGKEASGTSKSSEFDGGNENIEMKSTKDSEVRSPSSPVKADVLDEAEDPVKDIGGKDKLKGKHSPDIEVDETRRTLLEVEERTLELGEMQTAEAATSTHLSSSPLTTKDESWGEVGKQINEFEQTADEITYRGDSSSGVNSRTKTDVTVGLDVEGLTLQDKSEMEARAHKQMLEDLARENHSKGVKIFVYPHSVKPNQDIEVFLNRSMSTLKDETNILMMGAFNDWRWKSFTQKLEKTDLDGDWWSCLLCIPNEAYKLDFVFFNGANIYENNNSQDFHVPVEGVMDVLAFEDFLLEEKRRELEKIAAEQAERERQAEEQQRKEIERAMIEADKAQAKVEIAKQREALDQVMKKARSSIENVWHIEPSEFKGEDRVRFYYNRDSRPLSHAAEIWIHGGHNNWKDGLSIIGSLVRSDKKDGDWWCVDVDIPNRALVLDWVFADGPPQSARVYDNYNYQDFHAIVPISMPEDQYWFEEEFQTVKKLQEERRLKEEAIRLKAEKTSRMKAETKEKTRKMFLLSQKHIVYTEPLDIQAGSTVTVYYNPSNTVLSGKPSVWLRCSFNRWTHRHGPLPYQQMVPAENASHVKATVKVPLDAYMMDFVFSEKERGGIYDNNNGMDYHIPVIGGVVKEPPMHIVHVAVEMAPIAKVGGLGDVVTSLSRAVQDLGHNVDIILPKYDCMNINHVRDLHFHRSFPWGGTEIKVWLGKVEGLTVYFLEPQNGMFWMRCIYNGRNDGERFSFFCHAALEFLLQSGFHPDILHCHDWSGAPVAWLFKEHYMHYSLSKARVVFTIHNLEYGTSNIGKAMTYADKATTVSRTYSKEVSGNPIISSHLYKFHGIVNGIDPDIWDPYNDSFIPISYTSENVIEGKRAAKEALQKRLGLWTSEHPLVGIISRLTVQKGIHLIKHAISRTLERGGQVVLLGSAPDPRIQNDFVNLANQLHSSHGDQVRFCLTYDEPLSHLIYAGSDFILVPSIFEPCGLTQLIAMRYGSIPVVRKTGGLYDTVFDVDHDKDRAQTLGLEPNGFSFDGADPAGVDYALNRALSAWYNGRYWFNSLCKRVMEQDWSWNRPALDYIELYYAARK
ncbi:hypothetical protein QJS10_CPB11g01349 [Acorus calamus]|uniref:starch synthase n=1 Tax=Acorus calamus TaxID=4465 RepID=A0AAV9DU30_ACOCL|nr:hypothetical protein QJS10_CPB11g01349 [Acorus calamus]